MDGSGLHVPKPPLSDFVAFFWHKEGVEKAWKRERLLPTGTVELVVLLSDPKSIPVLCGPHNQPFFVENPGKQAIIGVHFRPGGAFPFFRVASHELHNQVVPLDDVWGLRALELRDRLIEAKTLDDRYAVLESMLLEASEKPLERRPEVRFALRRFLDVGSTVGEVADRVGYSRRHFVEIFRGEVGLTPKAYAKVKRFQHAIQGIGSEGSVNWADMALTCGYFDQAHFANDFRDFSGLTPSEYLALRTSHLNHVPVLD